LLFLLLFLGIEIAKYLAATKLGAHDMRVQPFAENSISALVQQLFLLQAIGPTGNALTFNGPAWSISVEFYTYLIFALIVLFLKPLKTYVFFAIAGISTALLMTKTTFGSEELLHGLGGFFIGCVTATAIKNTKTTLPAYLSTLCFISILLFLALKSAYTFDIAIYFLTAALIASLILSPTRHLKAILRHKILAWLGRISYSIYMAHSFVLWGVANIFKRLLDRPETLRANGKWVLSLTTGETCIAIFTIVALVLLASQITYTLIEAPLRKKSRRFAFSTL
jgi:peptidoglycan/LPS O-acetylase OafA/YrhL